MFKKLLIALFMVGIIAVPAMTYAQPVVDAPVAEVAAEVGLDIGDTVLNVIKDVRAGDWRHVAAGVLLLLMLGLRRFRDKLKIFKGDRGGSVLVLVLAVGGALATTLATDQPIDLKLLLSAVAVATSAAGGYTLIKKIVWPKS